MQLVWIFLIIVVLGVLYTMREGWATSPGTLMQLYTSRPYVYYDPYYWPYESKEFKQYIRKPMYCVSP